MERIGDTLVRLCGISAFTTIMLLFACDDAGQEYVPDWADSSFDPDSVLPEDGRNWDVPPVPGKCWGESVQHTPCPIGPCECAEFSGDIADGQVGPVEWLGQAQCVSDLGAAAFAGKHVYFGTELSPWCGVFACVTPKSPLLHLGIYAVRLDALVCELPPPDGAFFECDGAWDAASSVNQEFMPNTQQDCPQFAAMQATNTLCVEVTSGVDAQNYLVGVSAPADVDSADFTLHFIWRNDCGT